MATPGERIADQMRGMSGAIDRLRAYTEQLNQLDALNYVPRLERQINGLKLANEEKKKRIEELEEQLRQCVFSFLSPSSAVLIWRVGGTTLLFV